MCNVQRSFEYWKESYKFYWEKKNVPQNCKGLQSLPQKEIFASENVSSPTRCKTFHQSIKEHTPWLTTAVMAKGGE